MSALPAARADGGVCGRVQHASEHTSSSRSAAPCSPPHAGAEDGEDGARLAHARPESSTVSRCCINDLTKAPASYSQSPTCAHHDQQNGSRNLGTSAAGRSQSQRGAAAAPPGRRAAAERWRRGRAGRKTGQAQTRTHGQQGARSPAPCFPPRPRRQGRPLRGRGASASPVLSRCRRSPGGLATLQWSVTRSVFDSFCLFFYQFVPI